MGVKQKANLPLFESQECFWHHSCDTTHRFVAFSQSLDFLFVQILVFLNAMNAQKKFTAGHAATDLLHLFVPRKKIGFRHSFPGTHLTNGHEWTPSDLEHNATNDIIWLTWSICKQCIKWFRQMFVKSLWSVQTESGMHCAKSHRPRSTYQPSEQIMRQKDFSCNLKRNFLSKHLTSTW